MSTINRSSSLVRLLAAFFTLFIALGFCAALPVSSSSDVVVDSGLEVRGNTPSKPSKEATVKMGDTKFFDFKKGYTKVGSSGFNSCLGALIVSDGGAIIGHYTATHTDIKDEFQFNTKDANTRIKELYSANKNSIKGNVKTYVYVQKDNQSAAKWSEELKKIIKDNTGIQPEVKLYGDYTKKQNSGGFTVTIKEKKKGKTSYSVKWA
ncbi:hypothetical protein PG999_000148 [Apiospora kogelbergensis]|uniref:Uncharacterized protein n=1 Tax=Apiospora kogelbergensis TaxID=1337665 RepID=A0AAW0RAN3_9PEZI